MIIEKYTIAIISKFHSISKCNDISLPLTNWLINTLFSIVCSEKECSGWPDPSMHVNGWYMESLIFIDGRD